MYRSLVLILLVVCMQTNAGLWETVCPDNEQIQSCVCQRSNDYEGNEIICGGDSSLDLKAIFSAIGANRTADQKIFRRFILNNTAIAVLPESAFEDIVFNEFVITNCQNLSQIHRDTFTSTGNQSLVRTYSIHIRNNPKLSSDSNGDYSLFEALTKLQNIQTIIMSDNNNVKNIPENVFNSSMDKLMNLEFSGQSIESLADNAFNNLKLLHSLKLSNTSISSIPENAFAISQSSLFPMNIYLYNNRLINMTSFAANSLSNSKPQRPIILSILDESNKMSYISEDIFSGVLTGHERNKLFLLQIQLDCTDCRNKWLTNKNITTGRVLYLECQSGNPFDSDQNFTSC